MRGFLIDANLPYRFNLWHGEGYEHVFDHDDAWSDTQIWNYARNKAFDQQRVGHIATLDGNLAANAKRYGMELTEF